MRQHHLRSAHLEHHAGPGHRDLRSYRAALEVLHRVGRAMTSSDAGRAWSLTGPYGAGKSSFALFVHALLGPDGDQARVSGLRLRLELPTRAADPDRGRPQAFGATRRGFIRAAATAQREPISETIIRAFTSWRIWLLALTHASQRGERASTCWPRAHPAGTRPCPRGALRACASPHRDR